MRCRALTLLVAAGAAVPLAASCRSHNLSREQAGELIAHSQQIHEQDRHEVLLGPDARRGLGNFLNSLMGTFDYELADCLAAQGYLNHDASGYALTAKGHSAEPGWGKDPARPNARLIPVAEPEFVSVTGITQPEGGVEAEAEFSWRWRWTPIMNGMDNSEAGGDCQITKAKQYGFNYGAGQPSFDEHKATARFRRFDDGWRLEELQLHEPR